jgi:transposase InsO family protein
VSARAAVTTALTVGARVWFDGRVYDIAAIDGRSMTLADASGGVTLAAIGAVVTSRGFRVVGSEVGPVPGIGADLADLTGAQAEELAARVGHVREVLTGYRCGDRAGACAGEPRPQYDPGLPLMARYRAKAAEIGVTERTLRRWTARFEREGAAGVVDGRRVRGADPLAGLDSRWLGMCQTVLAEHVDASRPTQKLLLARIAARTEAEFGAGVVPIPGVGRARRALKELTCGTNALTGSTKGKREIAGRPPGVYGRLRPARPGEYVLVDTTRLDVFAMEPVTCSWVQVELTVAMDLYSRAITGLRLTPVSTKAVDAAAVLFETLRPETEGGESAERLAYAGVPDIVVFDAEHLSAAPRPGLPAVAAETLVVDHGKIYLSEHLRSVCARLGISIQPARPLMATDKAAIERFFGSLGLGLLAALPGYKGPDVYGRGKDPEGCAFYFLDELEALVRRWVAEIYHHRPHDSLIDVHAPGLLLSPAEMFAHGLVRAGILRVPARADLAFDFLPVVWRTIQHYGIEVHGLRYRGEAIRGLAGRRSSYTGAHAGKWPVRYDTDDISRVYFQHPTDAAWHELVWEHHDAVAMPFSAEALAFARSLAIAEGRGLDEAGALCRLLDDWDAGLVRSPVERRMAVRAGMIRAQRLQTGMGAATTPLIGAGADLLAGDDDEIEELCACPQDESLAAGERDFYADALEVLA